MLREIGSDFWELPPCCDKEFSIAGIENVTDRQLYISGRSAIRAFCRQMGEKKKILIPMYICETVIAPFEKEGWYVSYYGIKLNLQPDLKDLLRKIENDAPDILMIQSYFGFSTLDGMDNIVSICKDKGIIIVEDITQSLLSDFRKTKADYYVASFRKFFAIPEGGVLLSSSKELKTIATKSVPEILKRANEAFSQKKAYIEDKSVSKEVFLKKYSIWKKCFIQYDDVHEMNISSKQELKYIDVSDIKKKRRDNYVFLYDGLKDISEIACVFNKPKEQEVPLYLPIYVKDASKRSVLQAYLAKSNAYCPIIWPKYISDEFIDYESRYIYEHILCIPIDQRYGQEEMEYIIKILERGWKEL